MDDTLQDHQIGLRVQQISAKNTTISIILLSLLDHCERSVKNPILSSTLGGTPDAFDFFPSCLLFGPLCSRIARDGLRRVFSPARVSAFRAADERGNPDVEVGILLPRGHMKLLFYVVLETFPSIITVLKGPWVARVLRI